MPTPASGAISMNDMRTHINRATTSSISMSEMRDRYGGSGAISFSDLYDSEGFTVTCGQFVSKFFSFDGWSVFVGPTGSVSPNESNGHLQFAANSFLTSLNASTGTATDAGCGIGSNNGGATTGVTVGYKGTDVTRIVTANTSRSIVSSSENAFGFTYDVPSSGTIHCLIKF